MKRWPKSHGRGDPAAPSPPHDADHHHFDARDHDHVVEPLFGGFPADAAGDPASTGRRSPAAILAAALLLALAAFGVFGFLATFEPVDGALPWRALHGAVVIVSLAGARRLLRGRG